MGFLGQVLLQNGVRGPMEPSTSWSVVSLGPSVRPLAPLGPRRNLRMRDRRVERQTPLTVGKTFGEQDAVVTKPLQPQLGGHGWKRN